MPNSATAKYNIKLKIDNLNIEDVFDAHRLKSLKNLFKDQFWPQASSDLHMTNIASSLEVGYRHSIYIGTVSSSLLYIRFLHPCWSWQKSSVLCVLLCPNDPY